MSTKAEDQVETKTEKPGEQPPATPPPAKEAPKVEAKTESKTEKEKTSKEEPKPEGSKKEPRRVSLKDDDDEADIPENADLIELSSENLKRRLRRSTKAELKKRFGTDDFDEIKTKIDKLAVLEAKEEEREREKLSEIERERADKKKAEDRAARAEARLQAVYDERIIQQEDDRVTRLAVEAGMDPEYVEDQYPKLAKFLNENFKERQFKKSKEMDKAIKKWFEDRIKAKPKLAAETREETTKEEPPKPKAPLTNGAPNRTPAPKDGANGGQGKTMKPGQANSMTRQEARAEAARLGYKY